MLIGDNVFKEFKGAFTEQFVLQQLTAMDMTAYYWSNGNSPAEIDFVVQTQRPPHIHARLYRPRLDGEHPLVRIGEVF